jgi:pyruvate formate lyase activating enzyme
VCKTGAIQKGGEGKVTLDRKACSNCGDCVDACPAKALERFGRDMQVADVIRVVEEDSNFYSRSGGGVTLGGGEPLSQADFAARLLKKARTRGIHTAIETSGYCDWADLERVCRHVDQIFFDIKSMDPEMHKHHTGVSNRLILENFRKLCNAFPKTPIVVRTPVIPGFNASVEDIRAIVDYLNGISGTVHYELLPYHGFGEQKYPRIGRLYQLPQIKPPTPALMKTLNRIAVLKSSHRPSP